LGKKKFLGHKITGQKNLLGQKPFRVKKTFWVKKVFGFKIFLGQKNFWVKKFVSSKKICVKIFFVSKKNLCQRNFCVKIGIKKLFGPKGVVSENFLSKKTSRVNPRGRIMTPPPKKIVGLKFCWVVLSCPKRFFVKKKYW